MYVTQISPQTANNKCKVYHMKIFSLVLSNGRWVVSGGFDNVVKVN